MFRRSSSLAFVVRAFEGKWTRAQHPMDSVIVTTWSHMVICTIQHTEHLHIFGYINQVENVNRHRNELKS